MSSNRQSIVLYHMKRGFWIQVTTDYHTLEVTRDLTNGEDDLMSVHHMTLKTLIARGVVKGSGDVSPTVHLGIEKFILV